ncbi:hypothetical protein Micbo1qcDRAFT_169850 [Microdochium bolleyi]|uniref:Uncharacterized protein n=1 Tax=Microdochium bolleyi TaxID=196109 RepID=A0A136IIY9_9PEZI|nr:hypothetical protein Micbo1qcDRAFT_169850 [Microdochium bolleyi]
MEVHAQSGLRLDPEDWKLKHSLADWHLVEKAVDCDGDTSVLSDADRQRLVEVCGPFWGRALGQPASLTLSERHTAKGWPPEDVMAANVAKVAPGLTPQEFISKAAAGANWMTLEQTDLVDQRFNLLETGTGQLRTRYRMVHFDRYRAGYLHATAEERQAYRNSQLRGQLLRRPGLILDPTDLIQKIQTHWDLYHSSKLDLRDQPVWVKQILKNSLFYGFPVYFTVELGTTVEEKLSHARALFDSDEGSTIFESPMVFIAHYLKDKIFDSFGTFVGTVKQEGGTPRQEWITRRLCRMSNYIVSQTPLPQDNGSQARFLHRMARYGGALEEGGTTPQRAHFLDEQYFVVMDTFSMPPVADVLNGTDASTDVAAWIYDVDWEPPAGAARDEDGYAGRVKISFGYHLFVGLYPLLLDPEFTLKKVWAIKRSDDHMYLSKDFSALAQHRQSSAV